MDELERLSEEYDRLEQLSNEYDKKGAGSDMLGDESPMQNKEKPLDPIVRYLAEALQKYPGINRDVNRLAESPTINNINRIGSNVGEYINPFIGGALQTGGDVGASLGNLALKPVNAVAGSNYKIHHPDLRQYQEPGLYNDIGFLTGQIGAGLVGGGGLGTGKGIVQALQKFARPQGKAGLASDVVKGAGAGYALGENEEGDRTLGTILGGIAQPLSSITNSGITNRVLSDRARELKQHGSAYEKVFGAAEDAKTPFLGKNIMEMGDKSVENFHRLRERVPKDYREIIDKFLDDPSFKNTHDLQSKLGTFARNVEKNPKFKTNSLPPGLQKAYEAANDIRDALKKDISHSLASRGLIEESAMYPHITKSYAENAAPYFTKEISDVIKGVKHPHKLPKRLRENEQFMIEMGDRYPELMLNKFLPWATGAAASTAGAGAALLGFPKVSHAKESKTMKKKHLHIDSNGNVEWVND